MTQKTLKIRIRMPAEGESGTAGHPHVPEHMPPPATTWHWPRIAGFGLLLAALIAVPVWLLLNSGGHVPDAQTPVPREESSGSKAAPPSAERTAAAPAPTAPSQSVVTAPMPDPWGAAAHGGDRPATPSTGQPEIREPISPAPVGAASVSPQPGKTDPAATLTTPDAAPVPEPDADPAVPETGPVPTAAPAPRHGGVARAQFTSGIHRREPVDRLGPTLSAAANRAGGVYYFTELHDMQGHTVFHRWELDGKKVAEVRFPVRGRRWRVYSSKVINHSLAGQWRVVVTDDRGRILHSDAIRVQ